MKRYSFLVTGRVQGVGYRYFAIRSAEKLGVTGWVSNRADGAVEGEAQAAPEILGEFIAALRRGPQASRVDDVETTEVSLSDEKKFSVR